jgi:phage tail sheath protein FI
MVQVSYPGVYVQEIPSGSHTITGVATSIAAFVGRSKDGLVNTPTLVLGFTDYTRRFSDDISQGEMTDQVRQFFLNGGQQAYIVRIGQGILSASTVLTAPSGATLTLTALSGGQNGNNIRAIVDYDTADPERTFNLTVFRELTDPSGNTTTANQEIHQNLSMDANSPQFVETVLAQNSLLISAHVALGTAGTTAISASGTLADDIVAAIDTFIPAAGQGKFKISLGGAPFKTISIPKGALTDDASLETLINTQLALTTPNTITVDAVTAGTTPALEYLQLSANKDIVLAPASDSDIAVQFGLGAAQGGVEIGLFSADRPPASGLVSAIGANPSQAGTNISLLQAFAASLKADWTNTTSLQLTGGSVPFATIPGDRVTFPDTGAAAMRDTTAPGGVPSLLHVRDAMFAIAAAINGNSLGWRATVSRSGYRLFLRPNTGPSTGGAGAAFVTANSPPGFVTGSIFNAITAAAGSAELLGGDDGSKPLPGDYAAAYVELDKVDLFNILVLPRSAGDANDRAPLWGPASVFATSRRAFLVMDLDTTAKKVTNGSTSAAAQVVALRNGLTKDHAAAYWPRVQINPDGDARFVDPNGTIAGIMARIDGSRGVWKAPAGLEADLRGVLAVEVPMSDQENGIINPLALNAIRSFTNGIVSWGARTMDGFDGSSNADFKYVPVRRVESFIAESLLRGLKFAVFEPNDEPLWAQIRLAAGAFMNNLFRQGAFQGQSTREAYFVKCDSETTTQNDINLGIVNVVVGFAPLKPAEFVVITLQQLAGQVQV